MAQTYSRVTLAGPLLTIEDARRHLHITGTAYDLDIQDALNDAQELILAELGGSADASWTPETAPYGVVRAVRIMLAHLYVNRGDDLPQNRSEAAVWRELRNLLSKYTEVGVSG